MRGCPQAPRSPPPVLVDVQSLEEAEGSGHWHASATPSMDTPGLVAGAPRLGHNFAPTRSGCQERGEARPWEQELSSLQRQGTSWAPRVQRCLGPGPWLGGCSCTWSAGLLECPAPAPLTPYSAGLPTVAGPCWLREVCSLGRAYTAAVDVFAAAPPDGPPLPSVVFGVLLCPPGWSATTQSRLTGTSASQTLVILLPQPPASISGLSSPSSYR
ncbi:uncharacterized protein [Macaca fascicularis]|uniref:uncharacterized protein n=1 Tax=Macaca fascicularis TaxID=9541 RepID=UPI0032B07C40